MLAASTFIAAFVPAAPAVPPANGEQPAPAGGFEAAVDAAMEPSIEDDSDTAPPVTGAVSADMVAWVPFQPADAPEILWGGTDSGGEPQEAAGEPGAASNAVDSDGGSQASGGTADSVPPGGGSKDGMTQRRVLAGASACSDEATAVATETEGREPPPRVPVERAASTVSNPEMAAASDRRAQEARRSPDRAPAERGTEVRSVATPRDPATGQSPQPGTPPPAGAASPGQVPVELEIRPTPGYEAPVQDHGRIGGSVEGAPHSGERHEAMKDDADGRQQARSDAWRTPIAMAALRSAAGTQDDRAAAPAAAEPGPQEKTPAAPVRPAAFTMPLSETAMRAGASGTAGPAAQASLNAHRAENAAAIVQTIRVQVRDGISEATVRLHPEHLGEVTIAVRVEGRSVTAIVHAESADVREWLQAQEPALRGSLSEQGLQLDRLQVQRDGRHERRDRPPGHAPRARARRDVPSEARFEVIA